MNGQYSGQPQAKAWLKSFFKLLAGLAALTLVAAVPFSAGWLYRSGDLAYDRAAEAQSADFALYGPGYEQTDAGRLQYKLERVKARQPEIVVAGSASMRQLGDNVFSKPMVNMTGTASSLSGLRDSLDAMLAVHKPEVVLLGLDFWWFSRDWEADPFSRAPLASRSVSWPEALRMPWQRLLEGSISLSQFLFMDFRENRYGLRAHFKDEGYGPDGSWHPGRSLMSERAGDAGFARTLDRVRRQAAEFAPQKNISAAHLDALAEIYFRLRGRGITPVVFLAPLAGPVLDALKEHENDYPHLFALRNALQARGIEITDASDPRYLESDACEFMDGTHAGAVAALRVTRELSSSWSGLLSYLNFEQCSRLITEWQSHAAIRGEETREIWETDFLNLGCVKKTR